MKKRMSKGMACAGVLLLTDRLSSFFPVYSYYLKGFCSRTELTEELLTGDYNSAMHLLVVYMILFVLLEEYISELSGAFLCAGLFSLLHEAIGVAFVGLFGDMRAAVRHGCLQGILFQLCSMTLYLVTVYIWKDFFAGFLSAVQAQLVTIALFGAAYFVAEYFLFPGKGVFAGDVLLAQCCTGRYGAGDCAAALVKKACAAAAWGAAALSVKKRRDVRG